MTGYGSGAYGSGPYGGDTTPGGLPTVHVLLDDGTGTFPYDLTNMSGVSYVLLPEGFKHDHGRQDWQGGVTAGSLSLVLNNADGRFTPGSTIIASPSPIKVDQRIRITETVNGTTFTRFTGYVKQWPVAWPATVTTWATVQVMATDAQARAERRVLKAPYPEEVSQDAASYLYMMNEAGTVFADTSGNQARELVVVGDGAAVTPGTPLSNGIGGVTFAGGQFLTGPNVENDASHGCWIGFWFQRNGLPAASEAMWKSGPGGGGTWTIGMDTAGKVGLLGSSALSAGSCADNVAHHVLLIAASSGTVGGVKVYVDGVLAGTVNTPNFGPGSYVGADPLSATYARFNGLIGGLAAGTLTSTTLSGTRAGQHFAAGSNFAGESGTARLTRLAGYANLPTGTFDESLTNLAGADTAGRSAWEVIQQAADAEFGVAYVDGSGDLRFHNRNRVPVKTAPDLTMDKSYVTPDVQPMHDDQQIVNYIEATAEGTQLAQVARGTASESLHGRYPTSVSYAVQTDAEALDRANWIIANFTEPTTRYGTLTVNLYAMPAATAALTLAALEIGTWLQITGMPSQNTGGASVDLVVEGYSEQVTASSWTVTLNVVSKALTDAFILDDPVRGVLDAGNRLYV